MTVEDYTALVAELRQRARLRSSERFPPSTFVEGRAADAIASLERQLAEVRGERDRLSDELDDARHAPWPKWADEIRKCLEAYGVDPGNEWDLPEQFEDWIAGVVEGETARAETAEAERGRLAARCGELEKALRVFAPAELAGFEEVLWGEYSDDQPASLTVKLGDIRRVRAALQEPQT